MIILRHSRNKTSGCQSLRISTMILRNYKQEKKTIRNLYWDNEIP